MTDIINDRATDHTAIRGDYYTLAVDGWAVSYIWYSEEGSGRPAYPPSPLLAVPNVTNSPPINGQCTNFILFDVVALQLPLHPKGLIDERSRAVSIMT